PSGFGFLRRLRIAWQAQNVLFGPGVIAVRGLCLPGVGTSELAWPDSALISRRWTEKCLRSRGDHGTESATAFRFEYSPIRPALLAPSVSSACNLAPGFAESIGTSRSLTRDRNPPVGLVGKGFAVWPRSKCRNAIAGFAAE